MTADHLNMITLLLMWFLSLLATIYLLLLYLIQVFPYLLDRRGSASICLLMEAFLFDMGMLNLEGSAVN